MIFPSKDTIYHLTSCSISDNSIIGMSEIYFFLWPTLTKLIATYRAVGLVHLIGGLGECAAPGRFYKILARYVCKQTDIAVVFIQITALPGINHTVIC